MYTYTIEHKHGHYLIVKFDDQAGWYLDIIYVDEQHRGSGIAKEMLAEIANEDNYDRPIYLKASNCYGSDVYRLVKLYESFGFRQARQVDISTPFDYNMVLD